MHRMKAYVDGKFVELTDAQISLHDAGLQHGVGLFATMRAFEGHVFRLAAHVDRLIASARELGLTDQLRQDPLCEAVESTLKKNNLANARIRLTVTGGDMSLLSSTAEGKKKHTPTIAITVTEPTVYPDELFEKGVLVILADPKENPFDPMSGHKTLNYWSRLRALASAAGAGAGEALFFSVTNHLCGGAVSNVFLIKDQTLFTPFARGEEANGAIPSPVRPGITRAAVIELAEELDLPVERRMLSINDILEADEIFLTNSSWLILPVVRVEKETIKSGTPGEITTRLRLALQQTIVAEREAAQLDRQ